MWQLTSKVEEQVRRKHGWSDDGSRRRVDRVVTASTA